MLLLLLLENLTEFRYKQDMLCICAHVPNAAKIDGHALASCFQSKADIWFSFTLSQMKGGFQGKCTTFIKRQENICVEFS